MLSCAKEIKVKNEKRTTKNHRFIWNYSNESQNIDEIMLAPADVKIIDI